MENVSIVGFGCAGYHCAKALRESGYRGQVDVFLEGADAPSNPMLTTYYVAGKLPYEALFPFGSLDAIAQALRLRLHPNTPAVRLNAVARELILPGGGVHAFDQLLIATGAAPVIPPLGDAPMEHVFVMRTVEDAQRLRSRLEQGNVHAAVVVGASMAGIKVAELLNRRGIACTLADAAPRIFPLSALPEMAEEIQRRLTAQGIEQQYGVPLTAVRARNEGVAVQLGPTELLCDIVILCIGVRPRLGFVNPEEICLSRGVLVDEHMQTNVPGIYAAGDCCAGNNLQTGQRQAIGLWANAACQGRTAGRCMAGCPEAYPGEMLHNITHFMGMDFIGMGDVNAPGERLTCASRDGGFQLAAVLRDGRPECVNILDKHEISGAVKSCLTRWYTGESAAFTPAQCAVLLKSGIPANVIRKLGGL